ncbi:CHRD domain-containing protein [Halalkalicoccus salilacus]|uniref:CHRD domain-containing protein n=1 Tax=Halalkalicoccus TaxID=332246 RepID=UPI002F9635F7
MSAHGLRRRQVLSAAGTAIVGGLLATGNAAAENHRRTYRAELTGSELGIGTAASGTATVTVDPSEKDGTYEVHVECLRRGTHVSVSIDGGRTVTEVDLEGAVTEGLVRDATIAEGTLSDLDLDGTPPGQIQSAAKRGDLVVTVHTEQHPDGEIAGAFDAVSPGKGEPDSPDDGEDGDDDDTVGDGEYTVTFDVYDVNTGEELDGEVVVSQQDGDESETVPIEDGEGSIMLDAGEYDLEPNVEGYTAADAVTPPGVIVEGDTTVDYALFGGFELVTLLAQVSDAESGEPVEGAEVTGFGTSPTYDPLFEGTTDANGNVELDIENTRWQIDVTADGYERLQTSVDYSGAEEGETFEETFELQPADDGGDDTDDSESSASLTTSATDFVRSLLL